MAIRVEQNWGSETSSTEDSKSIWLLHKLGNLIPSLVIFGVQLSYFQDYYLVEFSIISSLLSNLGLWSS